MKQQGDIAELKFMLLNQELGYVVSKPFGDNAKYDMIVDTGDNLERIQVKSTKRRDTSSGMDCYNCVVCSGSDSKQRYLEEDIDYVAIFVIPENAWYKIPIKEINGKTIKLYPHRKSQRNTYEKYRI
jgi:PD-(D/E)XK endonuclease